MYRESLCNDMKMATLSSCRALNLLKSHPMAHSNGVNHAAIKLCLNKELLKGLIKRKIVSFVSFSVQSPFGYILTPNLGLVKIFDHH